MASSKCLASEHLGDDPSPYMYSIIFLKDFMGTGTLFFKFVSFGKTKTLGQTVNYI